jgi:hypothetical protein
MSNEEARGEANEYGSASNVFGGIESSPGPAN